MNIADAKWRGTDNYWKYGYMHVSGITIILEQRSGNNKSIGDNYADDYIGVYLIPKPHADIREYGNYFVGHRYWSADGAFQAQSIVYHILEQERQHGSEEVDN